MADLQTLNVVQEVLRGFAVNLVLAGSIDPARMALLLQAYSANEALDPMTQTMLLDLAQGLDFLGQRKVQ